jgi:hypothetical protein
MQGNLFFDIIMSRSPAQASIQRIPGALSSGARRLECEADHLPQSRLRRTHLLRHGVYSSLSHNKVKAAIICALGNPQHN